MYICEQAESLEGNTATTTTTATTVGSIRADFHACL